MHALYLTKNRTSYNVKALTDFRQYNTPKCVTLDMHRPNSPRLLTGAL